MNQYEQFIDSVDKMKTDKTKYQEVLAQQEEEFDLFLQKTINHYQDEYKTQKKKQKGLISEINMYKKKNTDFQERQDKLEQIIKDTKQQMEQMEVEKTIFQDKFLNMQAQLVDKENQINQKYFYYI